MAARPSAPVPDDKDWTWVLGAPCRECGFDADTISGADFPVLVREAVASLAARLAQPEAATRPSPQVWSPLEYACHVRDACQIFDSRLRIMLAEDNPLFANWDQDTTAIEASYWSQDPRIVGHELAAAGEKIAQAFGAVEDGQWGRPGHRSNGSEFTVDSLGRYFAHDLVHHVHDIGSSGS